VIISDATVGVPVVTELVTVVPFLSVTITMGEVGDLPHGVVVSV
jgi:hypothetical protein